MIQNDMAEPLRVREMGSQDILSLDAGERQPLFWLRAQSENALVAALPRVSSWCEAASHSFQAA